MSYNGWSNYETWAVALWINNEQGSGEYWAEQARDCSRSESARYALAERLKEEHEDDNPLQKHASVYSDLLTAALSDVDWTEIADSLLEDLELEASA